MTFADLYGERLDWELGSADRTNLFTTVRRKAAINTAQLEFVKQTECYVKTVDIPVVDETQEYDLDSTSIISAADFLWLAKEGAEYRHTDANGNQRWVSGFDDFPRRDLEWLNTHEPGWRQASSTTLPTSWYLREETGKTNAGLHPKPDVGGSESAIFKVPYVAMPPDMTGDGHVPFSITAGGDAKVKLTPWHQALVYYAAALLEPLRKNYQGEQRQRGLFAAQVADYLSRQRIKGGQEIRLVRNYYQDARRRSGYGFRGDPAIYP